MTKGKWHIKVFIFITIVALPDLPLMLVPVSELVSGRGVLAPLFGPRNVRKTPFPFLSSLASQ